MFPAVLTHEQIENYGLCIQAGAIIISAIGVIITLLWSRNVARRRATLDILLSEQTDQGTLTIRTEFAKLRDAGHLAKWANPEETSSEQAEVIRSTLNRYELVAIGIRRGIIDGKSYKRWCRTTLVKDWTACKPFVTQIRQNQKTSTFFCEFETLARKWASKAEKPHT